MKIIVIYHYILLSILYCIVLCNRYDKSAILFSPEGELLQVEYAEKASKKGISLIACSIENALILCSPTPSEFDLLDRRYLDKVSEIWDGLWICSTGLQGDGKALIREARTYCVDFKTQFGCAPSVSAVARHIGEIKHQATLIGGKRPYGVETLVIGYDEDDRTDPKIFMCKSSGLVNQWKAVAVGKESEKALSYLEKEYKKEMTILELIKVVVNILKKIDNSNNENGMDIYIIKHDKNTLNSQYPRLQLIQNVKDVDQSLNEII